MVRHSLLFFVIALIATIEFIGGFAVSVVPGWHTVIVPPLMIFSMILISWLYLLSVFYFVMERKNRQLPQRMFIIHLILTLFYFFYSNEEGLFYNNPNGVLRFIVPVGLFAIGQLIFIILLVKRIRHIST
jgi:hypothetical protein